MTTARQPVSVHLDARGKRSLDRTASLLSQSPSTILEKAGDEIARRILIDRAAASYHLWCWLLSVSNSLPTTGAAPSRSRS